MENESTSKLHSSRTPASPILWRHGSLDCRVRHRLLRSARRANRAAAANVESHAADGAGDRGAANWEEKHRAPPHIMTNDLRRRRPRRKILPTGSLDNIPAHSIGILKAVNGSLYDKGWTASCHGFSQQAREPKALGPERQTHTRMYRMAIGFCAPCGHIISLHYIYVRLYLSCRRFSFCARVLGSVSSAVGPTF